MEFNVEESNFEKKKLEDGVYPGELLEVKPHPVNGKYGARVILVFAVYHSEDEAPVEVAKVCNQYVSEKSQFGEVLMALGAEIKPGFKVNTDPLIGKPVKVVILQYEDKDKELVPGIDNIKSPTEDLATKITAMKAIHISKGLVKEKASEEPKEAPKEEKPAETEKAAAE
jgi:hypothetical protein